MQESESKLKSGFGSILIFAIRGLCWLWRGRTGPKFWVEYILKLQFILAKKNHYFFPRDYAGAEAS